MKQSRRVAIGQSSQMSAEGQQGVVEVAASFQLGQVLVQFSLYSGGKRRVRRFRPQLGQVFVQNMADVQDPVVASARGGTLLQKLPACL